MASPAQMFDHELNPVKGFVPGREWVVDKAIDLDATVTTANVKAGMIAHQDATSLKFKLGTLTPTNTRAPIPYFLFQGGGDFDVVGDTNNIVGTSLDGTLSSRLMGLSCTCAAEVETTEYAAGTYAPGDCLTSDANGNATVVPNTVAPVIICGVVSDGLITSDHLGGPSRLRLHTAYNVKFPLV